MEPSTEEQLGVLWGTLQRKIKAFEREGDDAELWMDLVVLLRNMADLIDQYRMECGIRDGKIIFN